MSVTKDYANIPNDSVEHFIPQHLLRSGTLADAGIILGGLSSLTKGYYISRPSRRTYHVIFCTISGTGTFYFEDGSKMVCKPNNIVFTHAEGNGHIIRKDTEEEPWEVFWLHIDRKSSWFIPPSMSDTLLQGAEIQSIKEYVQAMFLEETHQNTDIQVQELLMKLVLVLVNRMMHQSESPQSLRYKMQLSELWMQVMGSLWKPWTLSDLCSAIGMSKSNLTRLCIELHHTSPVAQVRSLKMEHAKYLLTNTDTPINRVAAIVGYKVPATFSAAFSNFYGFSPRDARKHRFKTHQHADHHSNTVVECKTNTINIGKGSLLYAVSYFLEEWNEYYIPVIISDEKTWDITGTKVHDLLTREGIGTKAFTFPADSLLNENNGLAEKVFSLLDDNELVAIVIGNEELEDIVKQTSLRHGKPYMMISMVLSSSKTLVPEIKVIERKEL